MAVLMIPRPMNRRLLMVLDPKTSQKPPASLTDSLMGAYAEMKTTKIASAVTDKKEVKDREAISLIKASGSIIAILVATMMSSRELVRPNIAGTTSLIIRR